MALFFVNSFFFCWVVHLFIDGLNVNWTVFYAVNKFGSLLLVFIFVIVLLCHVINL